MKNKIVIILLAFLIGIGTGAGGYYIFINSILGNSEEIHAHEEGKQLYTCGMHPNIIVEEPGDCPICGMKLNPIKNGSSASNSGEKKILFWRAPMNPSETYDAPGKSRMGMDLVPVYEDEADASGVVTVDGSVTQSMNVKIEHIKLREISPNIFTNGIVTTDERNEFSVNTKVGGWIENLYINYTGQKFKKGEKLVDIYSPELVAAQQELLTAIEYEKAVSKSSESEILKSGSDLVKNAIKKLELYDISTKDIQKLIESKNVNKLMSIYAPFNGTVLTKSINQGDKINAGNVIAKIADLSNLWILADVYESELNKVKIGSTAEITFSYQPDKIYTGKISFIYPTVDSKTRTVKVRINISNKTGELKPEMFCNIKINGIKTGKVAAAPETAIIRSGKKSLIILSLGNGRFQPKEVKLGLYSDGYYQILDGVKENDMVVTSAQFMIDSESSLRSAVKLFSSSDAKEHENMDMSDGKSMNEKMDMKENKSIKDDKQNHESMDMKEHDQTKANHGIVREGVIDVDAIDKNGDGKVFQDQMDWNVISDEAGKCPLCGMTLKEVSIEKAKSNLKEFGFNYK